jgi:hypothetical protein
MELVFPEPNKPPGSLYHTAQKFSCQAIKTINAFISIPYETGPAFARNPA